ncbi:TetR/AcrR family transcriptional regulator [Aminipila sp.]|uniref:TetR/AcrR family transcriptional regulator n=1 Tax=Aminipila sp. TaxID=2060095 RepID=UPI00289B7E80|nr:TetR-like C-terminal domain-containing protein [Aminipila sp.]
MESKRVQDTKQRIKNAFLELYKQKRIEKISIKEITEKAHINRGTFYVYYIDIYDLQEKVENEAIDQIKKHALPVIRALIMNKKIDTGVLPKEFFYGEQAMLELFFGERAELRAVKKLKKIMQETVMEMFDLQNGIDDLGKVKLKYALEYVSSAQLGMIGYWFKNNMDLPIEELGKIIEKINQNGVITYISKELK